MKGNEQVVKWIFRLTVILLTGLLVAGSLLFLQYLLPFLKSLFKLLVPFLTAGFIVYLLHPIVEKLESKHVPRPLSILLLFFLLTAVLTLVIMKAAPYIVQEGKELLEQLPELTATYRQFLISFDQQAAFLPESFQLKIDEWIQRGEEWLASSVEQVGSVLIIWLDWVFLLIVIPFIVFYALKDYPLLKKAVWFITPKKMRKDGRTLVKALDEALGGYIRGQIMVCILVGLLAWIGFWIIDMPYGALLAVFIGLTNIIPYFGPILGTLPVVILALTESFTLVLLGLGVVLAVQVVEGNILGPVIVGRSIHTHPLLIIFALVAGNEAGGIIGLILAVPVLAVLKVLALHIRAVIRQRKGIYD